MVYNVGLTRFDTRLPSAVWYLEGTEVGDTFTVPYHRHYFEDMNRDRRTALAVLTAVFCILLLSAIFPIAGEFYTRAYFHGLSGRTSAFTPTMRENGNGAEKSVRCAALESMNF